MTQKMKITSKDVEKYMKHRTDKKFRHCPIATAAACNDIYEEFKYNDFAKVTAKDLLKLLFFNDPIPQLHTHSYGFHTATGRHIIETLQNKYYEYKN